MGLRCAVLFVRMWPDALPAATFSLALYAFSFVFSVHVGEFVDKYDRMRVVRTSILGQKFCILGSCMLMYLIFRLGFDKDTSGIPLTDAVCACFGALLLIASAGELLGTAGCIALEKDWVVVLAAEISDNSDDAEESADTEDLPVSQTPPRAQCHASAYRLVVRATRAHALWVFDGAAERGGNVHGDGRDSDVFSFTIKLAIPRGGQRKIESLLTLSISAWNICSLLPEYYLALSLQSFACFVEQI